MTIVAGDYPVVAVSVTAGQVQVEVMGRSETLPAADEPTGVNTGLWWAAQRAGELGRPLRARVSSPAGAWMYAVDPSGRYEPIAAAPGFVPPPLSSSAATPVHVDEAAEDELVEDPDVEDLVVDDYDEINDDESGTELARCPGCGQDLDTSLWESVDYHCAADQALREPEARFETRETHVSGWQVPAPVGLIIPPNNGGPGGYAEATKHIATTSTTRRWWQRSTTKVEGPDPLVAVQRVMYMVANRKGEAGKTPVAVLLAAAFATKRPNDVVLVDLNPVGNLALRTVQTTSATVSDMVTALKGLDRLPYASDLDGLMNWQPEGFHAIPSRDSLVIQAEGDEPTLAPRLTRHDFDLLTRALQANSHVIGLDAGNNDSDEAWQRASELANVLVIPVKWDPPTCNLAGLMLEDLVKMGRSDLVRSAIIVPTWGPTEVIDKKRAKSFEAYFRSKGHRVMPIPPDPHLAGKGVITWARLKPATRDAALALAREVARG